MMTLDSQRLFLIEDETDRKRIETHGEMMLISHRHGNLHTRLIPFQTHTHTRLLISLKVLAVMTVEQSYRSIFKPR